MKVIIAGSRNFYDYRKLEKVCNWFLIDNGFSIANRHDVIVVSGGAEGADKLGESYAKKYAFTIKQFLPDWGNLGKSAAAIRNKQMANFATHCICFWDGKSKGTKMMIDFAKERGLKTHIEMLNSEQAPEGSDTTKADSSNEADKQKNTQL